MAYVDYHWYQTEYFGDSVPEEQFVKLAGRASEYIDMITLKRTQKIMTDNTDTEVIMSIKKAVCAVADIQYEHATKIAQIISADAAMAESNVESESVGKHSIHYAKASSPGTRRAVEKEMKHLMLQAVKDHLLLHNLIYNGVWS